MKTMLYPSVDSLKEKIDSKYTLVSLAAKRARDIQENHNEEMMKYRSHKNVGKALEEVAAGLLNKQKTDDSIVYEDEM